MLRSLALLFTLSLPALAADPVAATVNGETIRLADVDAVVTRLKPSGPLTNAQTKSLREAVLEELINELLVNQYLKKHAPAADAKEVDAHMAVLIEAQKKQGRTLADFCRETGFREAQLRASFEAAIRWRKLVDSRTSDAEFRKHFESNRAVFESVTVRISHILLRLGPAAGENEVNAAKETLRVLKADIEAKRISFADAAKKHSICVTAKIGGDLGTIRRKDGQVEEAIAAAAFALPVDGISEPVRSPAGLHLVCVTGRKDGPRLTFEECAEAVKEAYAEEARERLAVKLRTQADLRISLP